MSLRFWRPNPLSHGRQRIPLTDQRAFIVSPKQQSARRDEFTADFDYTAFLLHFENSTMSVPAIADADK
jgi:hypothetical protein